MERDMTDTEQPSTALDNLVQKLDDVDAELEIQSGYLGKIKMLLTLLILLMVPVVLYVLYIFYEMMFPRFCC
jgi:hypothetical protein